MRGLCRTTEDEWGWLEDGRFVPVSVDSVRALFAGEVPGSLGSLRQDGPSREAESLLPPLLPDMEVWAAGVTYESSKYARMSESESGGDCYARVYTADRPELFFKATPRRVAGDGGEVRIRRDSAWNVPEPELAVVVSARGTILGYTIGNDVSSRDIEGANPLYLPQAKVYRGSCALGPVVVPAESVDPRDMEITLNITRGGATVFEGATSSGRMKRTVEDLTAWLYRENEFPHGVALFTGTGIIPPDGFSLMPGDEVEIGISGIGSLRNRVADS